MVNVLASGPVDRGFKHKRIKRNTNKLVCAASPLTTQHSGVTTKTDWLAIRKMGPERSTLYPWIVVPVSYYYTL